VVTIWSLDHNLVDLLLSFHKQFCLQPLSYERQRASVLRLLFLLRARFQRASSLT
jgi:hypothetical protein